MAEDYLPLDFQPIAPVESLARAEAFSAQMARRRSVRFFSDRPLPVGLLEHVVATAGTAPSGANQQPWTFVAVRSPGLKRQIRLAAEEDERTFYSQRAPDSWLSDMAPITTGWEKPFLEIAPALLVVFRQLHRYNADGTPHKYYYTQESVGIAVGLLVAAIHNAGLVSLTHSPSPMEFLERILERPASEKAFLLMPVGYPADDATVPNITRKPLDEILIWK